MNFAAVTRRLRAGADHRGGGWRRGLRALAALLAAGLLAALFMVAGGGQALAAAPDSRWLATWNMQVGADRWLGVQTLARNHPVVALQEVPSAPPGGAFPLGTNGNISSYLWSIGGGQYRYLYILAQPSRNLGMVTNFVPDQVMQIPGPYRSALAVVDDTAGSSVMYASIHAASNGGAPNDANTLVNNVAQAAFNDVIQSYVVLGDYNLSPDTLFARGLPSGAEIYNSGQATQLNAGELDYMVANVETQNWQASVLPNQGSDHWPVTFSAIRAAAVPRDLTIQPSNSTSSPLGSVLDVQGAGTANGTHVITYHPDGGINQRWKLYPLDMLGSDSQMLYRFVTDAGDNCMDVNRGQNSRQGDYLNVWACHQLNGLPDPGGSQADTQNFTLEQPNPRFPNQLMIRDNATHEYVNVYNNNTSDGTWLIQWPYQANNNGVVPNEIFYLHPEE
ncbi:MAG TPA: RICIN domain-containing protein [Pseudonocardiaceae bacterium]|jgi:endonuclease/exonuclease/phosphatase family metal-dependent hydrolase